MRSWTSITPMHRTHLPLTLALIIVGTLQPLPFCGSWCNRPHLTQRLVKVCTEMYPLGRIIRLTCTCDWYSITGAMCGCGESRD